MTDRFVPRPLSRHERRIIVDALRRAAAETRTTLLAADGEAVVRVSADHRKSMESLAGDQDRLATQIDDPCAELVLRLALRTNNNGVKE